MHMQDARHVLTAAARMAYGPDSTLKIHLIQQLLNSMSDANDPSTVVRISLDAAAATCPLPAGALLGMLRADSCFSVQQSGGTFYIGLNPTALLAKGRSATKTGVLVEELASPVGYIDDLHPIRPGRPMCTYWQKFETCSFNRKCVYNHGDTPALVRQRQLAAKQQAREPAGTHSHAANSRAQGTSLRTDQVCSSQDPEVSNDLNTVQPRDGLDMSSDIDARAVIVSHSSSSSSSGGVPTSGAGQQQQQQEVSPQPVLGQCPMFMLRGFCPHGERCPYQHPSKTGGDPGGGALNTSPSALNTAPTPEPPQPSQGPASSPSAITRTTSSAGSSSTAIAVPSPQAGPWEMQQQQQQEEDEEDFGGDFQAQQPNTQGQIGKESRRSVTFLGKNELGLPMFAGRNNCAFYLGTGRCDFKLNCRYHHPRKVLVPECVVQGTFARRFDGNKPAPYSRLVSHLHRVWDYQSCPEAQLKVWLAYHLLSKENTACRMFSASAALPVAEEDSRVPSNDKPYGAYSSTLKEADEVLQAIWKAQPDKAASSDMPYSGRLQELLASDPFLEAHQDPPGVKLRVQEIKKLLNF